MATVRTMTIPQTKPSATNATIESATKIRELVAQSFQGLHRHEIIKATAMGKNRYVSALRFAVSSRWVRLDGHGATARVVAVETETGG